MTTVNPYIGFNGQCREAMEFYKTCIGGELFFQPVAGTPMAAQCPEAMQGQILHSSLAKGPFVLMATDMTPPGNFVKGNNISLSINCSSEDEITTLFSKLSEGGAVLDSIKPQFWGALFGAVTDKFGISWMLNYTKNQ